MNPIDENHTFILKGPSISKKKFSKGEYDSAPAFILQSLQNQNFTNSSNGIVSFCWNILILMEYNFLHFNQIIRPTGGVE